MKTFTVEMSNQHTGNTKVRTVVASAAYEAERKARSNVMMANGWCTDRILCDGVQVSIYA